MTEVSNGQPHVDGWSPNHTASSGTPIRGQLAELQRCCKRQTS